MDSKSNIWINEFATEERDLYVSLRVKRYLYSKKTKYQYIDIVDTYDWGKVFFLDNIVMTCDKYEFIYHEMISHILMMSHPEPLNALIIGGGDGGTAREVLKHDIIKRVDMVEIDGDVIEAAKQYLPECSCSFSDSRLNLMVEDGIKYVANKKDGEYQVAIIDSTDPIGPAIGLFEEEFYRNLYHALSDDGMFVFQSESPFYYEDFQKKVIKTLRKVFPYIYTYIATIPMYPGMLWTFTVGSKKYDPREIRRDIDLEGFNLKYYNKEIHKAVFILPEFVRKIFCKGE